MSDIQNISIIDGQDVPIHQNINKNEGDRKIKPLHPKHCATINQRKIEEEIISRKS